MRRYLLLVIGMGLILVLLVAFNAQMNERLPEFSLSKHMAPWKYVIITTGEMLSTKFAPPELLDPWNVNVIVITALVILSVILVHLIKPSITGFRGKNLWNWISVLFVPLVLGMGGLVLTKAQLDLELGRETRAAETAIAQITATTDSFETTSAAQVAQSTASYIETEQAKINATATEVGRILAEGGTVAARVEVTATAVAKDAATTQSAIENVQSAQTVEAIAAFNAQATEDAKSNEATLEALEIPTPTPTPTPTPKRVTMSLTEEFDQKKFEELAADFEAGQFIKLGIVVEDKIKRNPNNHDIVVIKDCEFPAGVYKGGGGILAVTEKEGYAVEFRDDEKNKKIDTLNLAQQATQDYLEKKISYVEYEKRISDNFYMPFQIGKIEVAK